MFRFEIAGLGIDTKTNLPLVLLHNDEHDMVLPIWIGPIEAQSIAITLQNEKTTRPLTHDLLLQLVQSLNCQILRVEINQVVDKTFYATLVIHDSNSDKSIHLDARPSDCIVLAARMNISILASQQVVDSSTLPSVRHYQNNSDKDYNLHDTKEFLKFIQDVKASDFKLSRD